MRKNNVVKRKDVFESLQTYVSFLKNVNLQNISGLFFF